MKCGRYHDLVMRYFDHTLNREEQESLRQHTDACPLCRALFNDMQGIVGTLETAPQVEPDPNLEKLVMDRIQSLPAFGPVDAEGFMMALYASISLAALSLVFLAALNFSEAGILELITASLRGLYSLTDNAWIARVACHVTFELFPQSIVQCINTIFGVYILAGLAAAFMVVKNLLLPGPAMHKMKF
jgi:hypothetical protein